MCYVCELCQGVVRHGEAQRLHTVERDVPGRVYYDEAQKKAVTARPRKEIARQYKVCGRCDQELSQGTRLEDLLEQREYPILRTVVDSTPRFQCSICDKQDQTVRRYGRHCLCSACVKMISQKHKES